MSYPRNLRTAATFGLVLAGLFGVLVLAAAGQPAPPSGAPPVAQAAAMPTPPGDAVGQLVADARASFARVRDYTGTMVKQERVGGQLQPEQFIGLRVRQQPLSIALKWQAPKQFEGQEAIYVAGRNNNKMRAKASGLAGAVGFLSLDLTDPRAAKQSRHPLTETGIGHLIETVARGHEVARRLPPDQVTTRFGEYAFQQKPCTRMEAIHLTNNGQFHCYRNVVYFDKATKLPVRYEAYDWPAPGGNANGELLECYSYIDLKFNVGLTDAAFGS